MLLKVALLCLQHTGTNEFYSSTLNVLLYKTPNITTVLYYLKHIFGISLSHTLALKCNHSM